MRVLRGTKCEEEHGEPKILQSLCKNGLKRRKTKKTSQIVKSLWPFPPTSDFPNGCVGKPGQRKPEL